MHTTVAPDLLPSIGSRPGSTAGHAPDTAFLRARHHAVTGVFGVDFASPVFLAVCCDGLTRVLRTLARHPPAGGWQGSLRLCPARRCHRHLTVGSERRPDDRGSSTARGSATS